LLRILQVLIEAGQRLPDGRLRQRGLPLSEKMIGQEDWQAAAVRAVSEELATALQQDWRQQVSVVSLQDTLFAGLLVCLLAFLLESGVVETGGQQQCAVSVGDGHSTAAGLEAAGESGLLQDTAVGLLAEKLLCCKHWQAAAVRAVSEDLATALQQDWRQQLSCDGLAV
jgi:hypothetical protein